MWQRFKNFRSLSKREKFLSLFLLSIIAIVLFGLLIVPDTTVLQRQSVEVTRWYRNVGKKDDWVGPSTKTWTRYSRVSKHMYYAIVAAEDSRFYEHSGLDFIEIMKSFQLNLRKGRFVRGGSTITQQVVKMALLSREKTLWRKFREALGAIRLEMEMSKEGILEWYINLTEFGDGVYGIKDAAWHYFRTKPELITIQQAVNLALVLPSPNSWSFGLRRQKLTDFGKKRYAQIVTRMWRQGFITKTQMQTALKTGDFGNPVTQDTQELEEGSVTEEHSTEELLQDEEREVTPADRSESDGPMSKLAPDADAGLLHTQEKEAISFDTESEEENNAPSLDQDDQRVPEEIEDERSRDGAEESATDETL